MSKFYLALFLFVFFLVGPKFVSSQSTPDQIETQKRLNEVEANRLTPQASRSATKKVNEITFAKGTVTSVTKPLLFITTHRGSKTVMTNDGTKFINFDSKGKKLIGFGDLKNGESILVIGLSADQAIGTAKIIVRDQTTKPNYFSLFGRNQEFKDNSLFLKDLIRQDLDLTKVTISTSTKYYKNKIETDIKSLSLGEKLALVGTIDEKGNLVTEEILSF